MNLIIDKTIHTISISENDLINSNSSFIFKDNYLYIFEKEPFVEYNIEDLDFLIFSGKIKHKIGIFICQY